LVENAVVFGPVTVHVPVAAYVLLAGPDGPFHQVKLAINAFAVLAA